MPNTDGRHKYESIIGGCYFINVPTILQYNGQDFITVEKQESTGAVCINTGIMDRDGNKVADIINGEVRLQDKEKYQLITRGRRTSILEAGTARFVYDAKLDPDGLDIDVEASFITYLPSGIPVFFHPNRIKIGSAQILRPNLSSLRLLTDVGEVGLGPALKLTIKPEKDIPGRFHDPAPIVGANGVINRLLESKDISEITSLMKYTGESALINMDGPCYLLDMVFENFDIAISVEIVNEQTTQ